LLLAEEINLALKATSLCLPLFVFPGRHTSNTP
jgi:hypothetical protein